MNEIRINNHSTVLSHLVKGLNLAWQEASVPKIYQTIILSYISLLTVEEAEALIQKEIQEIKAESPPHANFIEQLQRRMKTLVGLKQAVEDEGVKSNLNNRNLSKITQLLSELRTSNLLIIEIIVGLHRQWSNPQQNAPQEVKKLLLELHSDNSFLKESILSRFIHFQEDFDPLFIHHKIQKNQQKTRLSHPILEQFFKMDIPYAARLRKTHRQAQRLLNNLEFQHSVQFKRRSHSYNPVTRITPIDENSQDSMKKDQDSKRSRSNFKIRALAIQTGSDVNIKPTKIPVRNNIIKKQSFRLLTEEIPLDESRDQDEIESISVRQKITSFPRSRYLKASKAFKGNNQQCFQTKKHSFYMKEKLIPLPSKRSKALLQVDSQALNVTKKFFYPPVSKEQPKPDEQSELKSTNDSQKIKQIKMKAPKLTLQQLKQYLSEHSIYNEVNRQITIGNFSVSIAESQSYFSEFLVNGDVKAFAIGILLPNGDYLIRLWLPVQRCSEDTSKLLFGKYMEYLQKQANCSRIFLYATNEQLALTFSFVCIKDKLFAKDTSSQRKQKSLEFPQFLSFKCTNLLIPQQNTTISMLYSDQIQAFNESNYYVEPAIAAIDRQKMSPDLQLLSKINHEISGMKALNSLLQDEQLDTFGVTSAMNYIANISALRLASDIHFASSFVAGEGYFKFKGNQVYRKDNSVICKIEGLNKNFSVILGKGFTNMHNFLNSPQRQSKKQCEFIVKMFSKQLYGRMVNNSLSRCSYANWEVSLSLKDELQGRVRHSMEGFLTFGPQQFYLGIQMNSQMLFCFQVGGDDFLY